MRKGPPSTPRGDQASFLKAVGVPWAPRGPTVPSSLLTSLPQAQRNKKKKNGWGCMKTEVHLVGLLPVSCQALSVTSLSPSLLKFAVWCSQTPRTFTHFQRKTDFHPKRTFAFVISYGLCNVQRGKPPRNLSVEVKPWLPSPTCRGASRASRHHGHLHAPRRSTPNRQQIPSQWGKVK